MLRANLRNCKKPADKKNEIGLQNHDVVCKETPQGKLPSHLISKSVIRCPKVSAEILKKIDSTKQ